MHRHHTTEEEEFSQASVRSNSGRGNYGIGIRNGAYNVPRLGPIVCFYSLLILSLGGLLINKKKFTKQVNLRKEGFGRTCSTCLTDRPTPSLARSKLDNWFYSAESR